MNQLQHLTLLAWVAVALFLLPNTVHSQQTPPSIEWQKSLGGSGLDAANSIAQTSDGGYIVAGSSRSTDGDVTGNHGGMDYWIVKLRSTGEIAWEKSLGGSDDDFAFSIAQTSDGGYIVAGNSESTDGDVAGHHGLEDYWIVKLTSTGEIEWQKSLGGSGDDYATSIKQTSDGGYIAAGYSSSADGDITGKHGAYDYWIVKLTSIGVIKWQKSLGGSGGDYATSIEQTSDGGYVIAGFSFSTNGDVTGHHELSNCWIVKLTSTGVIEWQRSLSGSDDDYAISIKQASNGGYIVAGYSSSTDGDVTENHGGDDYWIVKLASTGVIEWQRSLGRSGSDYARSIAQTSNGGYIVAGESSSNDGDVAGNHGEYDSWIVKLTSTGGVEWEQSLGGSESDYARSIAQASDGGYIVAGWSYSTNGDVTGHHGSSDSSDYWIIKLAPQTSDVTFQPEPPAIVGSISVVPNPAGNTAVLSITSNAEAEYTIELASSLGEVVKQQRVELGIGEQTVQLTDLEGLTAGSYEVIVYRGRTQYARGRVVVVGK